MPISEMIDDYFKDKSFLYNVTEYDNELTLIDDIEEINKFDIIFLDPPYKLGQYEKIISLLLNNNLLSERGIIVIESDHDIEVDESYFARKRDYKYGEIKVRILWRK